MASLTHEQYEARALADYERNYDEPEFRKTFRLHRREVYRDGMNCLRDAVTHQFVKEGR